MNDPPGGHVKSGPQAADLASPAGGTARRPAIDRGRFSVSVRDRAMCAHSFTGELFGPAQNLHGITFIIDAVFYGTSLVPEATYLLDICLAEELLKQVVSKYHNQNLDDVRATPPSMNVNPCTISPRTVN